ncbi:HD domain-containing phosphohydrolase [Thalassoglobus polymorphus]|uniref:Cyclic di-GMP phosphodiesterase response regulator RpfG n=1 Tax=Thalassoglobus polymorphus TaxID=2527994 RepID=A0A517QMB1_9PLAN|nr:HD domain-containing phosphohydrolase [Thalassoglobus polymorphus]QDT32770.1 Cyclic di-GMP phosphodiesterase response regulator RpfG [Thalassoglobus polymorphus]
MQILVADDDTITAEVVAHALRKFGYEVTVVHNGLDANELLRTGRYKILISDWQMPGMTGLELCEEIRSRRSGGYIYVILLTSHGGIDNVVCGLEAGADDFLTKPFDPTELLVRVRVGERVLNLESRELMIFALAKLAESRDRETGAHLERMREYARVLADELTKQDEFCNVIDGEYVNLIYLTTPLHDIGKVAIPDHILLKEGSLTETEFEIMKTHTLLGAQTLREVSQHSPCAGFLQMATDIAISHHERFDGTGYPYGISGEEIPLCGRITAVADVYDALTSKRVYKEAYSHRLAKKIILEGAGAAFDSRIVEAFLQREADFISIQETLGDHADVLDSHEFEAYETHKS